MRSTRQGWYTIPARGRHLCDECGHLIQPGQKCWRRPVERDYETLCLSCGDS